MDPKRDEISNFLFLPATRGVSKSLGSISA